MNRTALNYTTLLLYVFGFLLLLEWMYPVEQLTDTGNIWVFMLYLLLALAFSYFQVGLLYRVLVKTGYVLFALHYLYFAEPFFSFGWLPVLLSDFAANIQHLVLFRWDQLSNIFRSILFFILIGLMAYLMKYWLVVQRRILVFFIMTLIYVTVLDTFTVYDASAAIIRTVIIGFLLMGILTFLRVVEKERIAMPPARANMKGWILPFVFLIAASTFFAYVIPKSDPRWPDPVPYIESFVTGIRDGTWSQGTGFGTDDSRLGGPFRGDDRVVYVTKSTLSHYWRVETKDVYTGKGWVSSRETVNFPLQNFAVPFYPYSERIFAKENHMATIEAKTKASHLIYPAGVRRISSQEDLSFHVDISLEKIHSQRAGKKAAPGHYEVYYNIPDINVNKLKSLRDINLRYLDGRFLERYTQLPDSLPQRVKELAHELTAGHSALYDKVKAVENYFKTSGFVYEQTDVETPGLNDDYVDQFLFETKRGYCDNFSTSMIVLLRSAGIPARWVKGYTEGEFRRFDEQGLQEREITNNNAHSWVEVYFPDIGWIPFEPTISFTGNPRLQGEEFSEPVEEEPEVPEENGEEAPEEEPLEPAVDENSGESSAEQGGRDNKAHFINIAKAVLAGAAGILIITGLVLFFTRKKWLPYYYISRFKKKNDNEAFLAAYQVLLKQLERCGIKRRPEQTLREYAQSVDLKFSTTEMSMITSYYEHYLYKGVLGENTWQRTREAWERMMKTIA